MQSEMRYKFCQFYKNHGRSVSKSCFTLCLAGNGYFVSLQLGIRMWHSSCNCCTFV